MLLYGDYHTHTLYSRHHHGKGTVLENASVAADKGLKQIAITDHGFNHEFFGIRRKNIPSLQEDILNAKEKLDNEKLSKEQLNNKKINNKIIKKPVFEQIYKSKNK